MPKHLLPAVLLAATLATAQEAPGTRPQQPMPVGLGSSAPATTEAPLESWPEEGRPLHPRFAGEIAIGGGRFEHRTTGSNLDDSTGGAYFRMQFEAFSNPGFGGGIRLEGVGSEDDLFTNTSFAVSQASSAELFAYFAYRPPQMRAELPLRVGLMLHNYGLEENVSGDRIDYTSIGVRFEAMPDFPLIESDHLRWSIYTGLSSGFGATRVQTDPGTFEADCYSLMFGFDLGTRLRIGSHANLGIGWVYRAQDIDKSETVGTNFFLGVDQSFSGLLLSFGLTF